MNQPLILRNRSRDAKILTLWRLRASQADIARRLKISRERVRQILNRELPLKDYIAFMCTIRRERQVETARRLATKHRRLYGLKKPIACAICGKAIYVKRRGQGQAGKVIRSCSPECRLEWMNKRYRKQLTGGVTAASPVVSGNGGGSSPLLSAISEECPCNDP